MSPTNKICKQRKSLSLTISKKSNSNDDKQQQNINELQEEIRKLKTMQNITVGTANINQTKINNPPHHSRIQKKEMRSLQRMETSKKTLIC